jgi:hypothetical protein
MSKILRRPMFRGGGKVSSYGNGIASGMGYAGGGRVNLVKGGNPLSNRALVNLGGGSAAPTQSTIGGNILNKNVGKMSNIAQKGANLLKSPAFSEAGIMNAIKNYGPKIIDKGRALGGAAISRFPAISFGLAGEYLTRPQDVDKVIYEQEGYGPIEGRMRQIFDPTYMSKMKKVYEQGYNEDGQLNAIINKQIEDNENPANEAEKNPGVEINVNEEGKPTEKVLTKKERLDKAAKEYEDILGAGIKRDSIFDAMIEGGTRLYEGEGVGSAVRAANKALDPIQNIKTASRKLALEEDIAIRKAIATGAAKDTDMSRRIAALRAGGYTPEQIADAVAGTGRPKSKADYIKDTNSTTTGLTLWVKDNVPDLKSLLDKKAIKDPKVTATLEDGKHYIPELFTLITIKEGVVVDSEKLK